MPRPSKRTRNQRRIDKKLPGKGHRVHYERKANASKLCYFCKRPLAGIPHLSLSGLSKLNRSKKRTWRPYGGQVCHNCLKDGLKQAARSV